MFDRSPWKPLLLVGFAVALAGCTNNLVDSIVITPGTQSLTVGQTVQFTAIAYQTHGTHPSTNTNVTTTATWTSSAPSIVTVNSSGLATAVAAGTATIGATMQGFGGLVGSTAVVTVTGTGVISSEPLVSLAIDPGSQTAFAVNQTLNFIAIGTTGSSATVNLTGQSATVGTSTIKAATWTSSSPQVATVNPNTGVATALTNGTTTITAQAVNPDGTVVVGTATLTVTLPTSSAEPLVSMVIVPGTQTLTSLNQPAQFIAIGTTGIGTTVNLTNKVIWTSSSPTVASINANTGLALALSNGTSAITAVATNPDGTVVTGVASVTVNIAATGEPLVSLAIVPNSQTASVVGQTVQFTAIGTTSTGATVNLTNQPATVGSATINAAVWGSSSAAVATINGATGLAAAQSAGTVAITAQAKNPDGTVVTGTATFTVITTPEPLISLDIVPATQTLVSAGQTAQYIAIGTTASGATVNLTNVKATIGTATINAATWGTSSGSVATINPLTGVATAGSTGIAVITAVAYNPDGTAVTATATLNVNIAATSEPLVSLAIVPASQTASVVGQTAQYIAIGTTSSGATVDVTNQTATIGSATINPAVWGSSSAAIATVNPATGLATAVSSGTVAITAQAKNPDGTVVTAAATFTVTATPEPLLSLTIVPATQTLVSAGETEQYIAIGTTSTGATVNLTNVKATIGPATINAATWATSTPAVATISPTTGIATAMTTGVAVITAVAYNPDGTAVTGTATLNVNLSATPEPLISLAIVPVSQTASVVGQTAQYIAIGTTSTGATVNLTNQPATIGTATVNAAVWGSSSSAVATVNAATGLATAQSAGTVAITAQAKNPDGTVVTAAATFTIITTPEPLISLVIVPATQTLVTAGETTQYIAIGTTASGATVNLTNAKATIGTATINAATWASSTTSVASINSATGLAVAGTSGITVITAIAFNPDGTAVTGTATLNVNIAATAEPLVSLAIVPASQTASLVGQTAQFIAIGTTSSGATVNLTNQSATIGAATINAAVWGSSSNSVATVNQATGLATALDTGTVAITAQAKNPDGTVVTAAATFTVISAPEPLVSLTIVPGTQTLATAGEPVQFIAIGTTASGATVNLTNVKATIGTATINAAVWGSSTASVATINPATGLGAAATSGVTVITAVAYNPDGTAVTGTATLTVNLSATPEPLVSLAIVPASQTASVVGQTAQFIAIGTTSSGATVNLTNQSATVGAATINAAVWGSSSNAVATVNPATGLATAVNSGTVAITAQAKNPDGTVVAAAATFTVTTAAEPLISLAIVPAAQTLVTAGETTQYIAIGTTSTGTTVNLTNVKATIGAATINAAVWGSSTSAVATINPATGVASAATTGVTVITAVASNPDGTVVTGTATLNVNISATQEPLVSLSIVPASQTASVVGQTAQYIAIGTTSSGATVNLTNQSATVGSATIAAAIWGSSSEAISTINAATGLATAQSAGTVAITAQAKNPDGTVVTAAATFTVITTPEPLISLSIVPATQTLATAGEPVHYVAIGTTASGATVNLTGVKATIGSATINAATWASTSPTVASIDPASGIASALTSGVTVITAIAFNPDGTAVTGTATLTVNIAATAEPLVSLAVVPATQTASVVGQAVDFIAIGTTSSGATVNLTTLPATVNGATVSAALWGSSSPAVATIGSNTGIATAVTSGTVAITAQAMNPDGTVVTGTATLTVTSTPEPLVSIAIVPATQTLATVGEPVHYIAIGTTASGATVNLTNVKATIGTATIDAAVWASSSPTVATIDPATGVALAATSGITVITATAFNPDGTAVTGTATLTVNIAATAEPIVSLAILPASQTASVTGQTAQFIAIGTTSSGTTVNLTNQTATVGAATISAAVWGSSSNPIATIDSATGVATAVSSGTVAITAQAKNPDGTVVIGTATLTVLPTPEPVVSLTIVPATQTASVVGQTAQYIVIGTTSTGATVNLTNQSATVGGATIKAAVWNSSIQQIATIDQTGLATVPVGAVNGVTVITAVATNPDGTAVTATATLTLNITAASEPLVSLAIIPGTQTASVVGQTVQYIVIGTTSTGSTVNLTNQPATIGTATIKAAVWGSSSTATATIDKNTGLATAVSAGTVAITAIANNPDGTAVIGTATFTVSPNPEPLVSISIVPGALPPPELTVAGQTLQYIAIGTTSSGATVNLTSTSATIGGATISPVVWSSSTLSVATIGTTGVVGSDSGLAVAGITGVTGITAIAYNPDGTAVEGTSVLQVASGIPVNNPNLEPIISLAIVPTAQFGFSVYENPRPQFVAIGTTSTGTTVNLTSQQASVGSATVQPATWSSSNPTVATTNPGGIVSPVSTGSTAITAATVNPDQTVMTGTASYSATATGSSEPIVAININPAVPTPLAGGQTVSLTVTGISGALATVANPTVVWASSNPGVATVNAGTGVVTAVGPGVSAITATATNPDTTMPTGVVVVTVTSTAPFSGSIAYITVTPAIQTVPAPNDTAQYIAIGTTTTGQTVDLTNLVAWKSSSAQIGTINAATGLATGTGQGTATMTALYTPGGGGNVITGTAQFSVAGGTNEQYTAVTLIPNAQALAEGQTSQFVALGTLGTTGLLVDVTNSPQIKWTSDVPSIASIVLATGLASGVSAGNTTITAELSNPDGTVVSGNAAITVSATTAPEPLLSLTIIPGSIALGDLQDTGQFLAIGTFSVAPFVRDLTNDANTTWISSFPDTFPVNTNSGGTPSASAGIVTAYGTGSATIIAETQNPIDKTIQTATATISCILVLPSPDSIPPIPGNCDVGEVGPLKATLTIYGEGLNTTNWVLTAPSATATPDVIHCGPGWTANGGTGGSVCTAIYPIGTTVTITAAQAPSTTNTTTFGGWTYNCTPTAPIVAAGTNSCTISLGATNATVGAIFN